MSDGCPESSGVRSRCPTSHWQIRGSEILIGDVRCTFKSGMVLFRRRCPESATAACVYCNEPFCDEHGTRGPDYYEICARERCQAKFADLGAHQDWVRRQHRDNIEGYCAHEECDAAPDIPCERCGLRFCQPHVRVMSVPVVELLGGESIRSQLLCPHCIARRKIWD